MWREQLPWLDRWLTKPSRKPLVVRGARQVGKSTLVRRFAAAQGLILHEINFERARGLDAAFASNDIPRILTELQLVCRKGAIDAPRSLLFLDEIQAVPQALPALRYFLEQRPSLPVIAAGSLLEFVLAAHDFSMPVGRVEYLFMGPMKFEEYLAAAGDDDLVGLLQTWVPGAPFAEVAHRRLLERLRDYLIVGGMPEAVSTYVGSRDLRACYEVQSAILETYRDDFPKYGRRGDSSIVHKVYDYVPRHVGEKIKYANIDRHAQARALRGVMELLFQARVAFPVYRSTAAGLPLGSGVDERVLKPYFLDCGLVARATGAQWIDAATLASPHFVNSGKLAEQFAAQHLLYGGAPDIRPQLYYWLREGRSNNAEVDFLTDLGSAVAPVEVKSGKSGTMKSLFQYAAQRSSSFAIRFDVNPPSLTMPSHDLPGHGRIELQLLSLPLYLVQQYRRLAAAL